MSDKEERSPAKVITPKQQMKLKNTTTFKSKTRLQKLQNLPNGSPRNVNKIKSPATLQKQLNNKEEGGDKKPKAKKKISKAIGAHSGVPPNPKLRQAFQGLKAKLENMKS